MRTTTTTEVNEAAVETKTTRTKIMEDQGRNTKKDIAPLQECGRYEDVNINGNRTTSTGNRTRDHMGAKAAA